MSVITTKRNHVAALEPLPTDVAVVSRIGKARVVQPIQDYEHAVSEAVRLADHMQHHIDVVPVDTRELLGLSGMSPEAFIESLSPAGREELREICICSCIDVISNCDDAILVAEAADALAKFQGAH